MPCLLHCVCELELPAWSPTAALPCPVPFHKCCCWLLLLGPTLPCRKHPEQYRSLVRSFTEHCLHSHTPPETWI